MKNNNLKSILIPFLAVFIALIIGAVIIMALGDNPLKAYYYLFTGAFYGKEHIANTLLEATPMIFTGLSVLVAFKSGLFNIGAQGQVIVGGLAAAAVGGFVHNVGINNVVVVLLISASAGFIWAGIAGWLKAKLGVHEVISTIMLNYIAINLEQYALNYPLKAGGAAGFSPQTPPVLSSSRLAQLMPDTGVALNAGFLIAIAAVIVVWFLFEKTIFGYEIKAVGYNPTASENAGINIKWTIFLTMGLAGALAGLAGAERVLGGAGLFTDRQGLMANYGFDGIAVALLGKNSPIGVLFAAILFGALRTGGDIMQFNSNNIPSQIIIIIQAIIILLIASENMFYAILNKKKVKK